MHTYCVCVCLCVFVRWGNFDWTQKDEDINKLRSERCSPISLKTDQRSFRCSWGVFFFQLLSRIGSVRGGRPAFLFPCWNPQGSSTAWSPHILFKTRGYGISPGGSQRFQGVDAICPPTCLEFSVSAGTTGVILSIRSRQWQYTVCFSMQNVTQVYLNLNEAARED